MWCGGVRGAATSPAAATFSSVCDMLVFASSLRMGRLFGMSQITENTAAGYLPQEDTAKVLAAQFDATYAKVKV